MHSNEPMTKGQIGGFHYGSTAQGGSGSAGCTLKLFDGLHPIMGGPFTFPTSNADFHTVFPERNPAGFLIWELAKKFYQLHIHNFEAKVGEHSVIYLRFGS